MLSWVGTSNGFESGKSMSTENAHFAASLFFPSGRKITPVQDSKIGRSSGLRIYCTMNFRRHPLRGPVLFFVCDWIARVRRDSGFGKSNCIFIVVDFQATRRLDKLPSNRVLMPAAAYDIASGRDCNPRAGHIETETQRPLTAEIRELLQANNR